MTAPERRVRLPKGRELLVRAARADDVDALVRLYDELPLEDRYRRFFSAFRPSAAFLSRWLESTAEAGCCLVAEVDGELVGEAGFLPSAPGVAELALTVRPAWRGWLGPYLLDALVAEAAAQGLVGLDAEVLAENRPMLTLLRHRGAVTQLSSDATVVRVLIGTHGPIAGWPGTHARPRLLVEGTGGRWHDGGKTKAAGVEVITCPGPSQQRHCPAVEGATCPLVEGADAVLLAVREGDPYHGLLADAAGASGIPVATETDGAISMAEEHYLAYRDPT